MYAELRHALHYAIVATFYPAPTLEPRLASSCCGHGTPATTAQNNVLLPAASPLCFHASHPNNLLPGSLFLKLLPSARTREKSCLRAKQGKQPTKLNCSRVFLGGLMPRVRPVGPHAAMAMLPQCMNAPQAVAPSPLACSRCFGTVLLVCGVVWWWCVGCACVRGVSFCLWSRCTCVH